MAAEHAPRAPHTEADPAELLVVVAAAKPKARPPLLMTTEKTPLVLKVDTSRRASAEEVHPLPWFRSPELARTSPPGPSRGAGQKRSRLAGRRGSAAATARSRWWCFGGSAGERDAELGYGYNSRRAALAAAAADDADGFRQCVQLLVALIVVVAIALILVIILQPFREGPDELAAPSGGW
ncbi:hypothetical protein PybrP1_009344 [[Pythium] brassicae (nom. inval.)]|nr:hypothetical protein PybrP1_009344 [[Pythium] brassicae (nom. inval.)]